MRRSILFSLVIIGAVIAVVAGASSFASFTDSDTISGTVTAGILQIDLADTGPNTANDNSLTFDPNAACPEMDPDDSCVVQLQVRHGSIPAGASNLELTYTATLSEAGDATASEGTAPEPGCFQAVLTFNSTTSSNSTGALDTQPETNNGTQATFKHVNNALGDGANADALDPGEVDNYTITVTLDNNNACQGVGPVTYTVTVNATQSSSPHD